jgi:hypothetical protein
MTAVADREARSTASPRPRRAVTGVVLAGWLALVCGTRWWGQRLLDQRGFEDLRLGSPPFTGRDDVVIGWRTLVPIVVAVGLILVLPTLVRRLSWRRLLLVVFLLTAVWAVAVNLTRGWDGVTGPMLRVDDEYYLDVPKVGDPGEFLERFTTDIDDFVVHVRSHPPGFLLLLWAIASMGLSGPGWAAALCVLGGAAASPAVLVALRNLAGEDRARRAAPFLVLAPAGLWIASSADALYAGVAAWSVALLVLATSDRSRRGDLFAAAAGLAFGAALMFSYGLVLVALVALPVLVARRRVQPALVAACVAAAVIGVFATLGFNYLEGFEVARREVGESVQHTRPFSYFAFSNLAAFAVVVGPATVVALTRLRHRATWLVVGGALAAVAVADLSALSKGEVERIWLPFAVWTIAACSALVPSPPSPSTPWSSRAVRSWLAVQAVVALVVQTYVRTGW